MGLFKSIVKGIEKGVEKQLEDTIYSGTGVNVRREVTEYDREIESLEQELEQLENEKDSFISSYGEEEYVSIVRDIKKEIKVCKQIKIDIMKEIIQTSKEESIKEYIKEYQYRIKDISDKQLEKILEGRNTQQFLKEVVEQELESRRY